MHRGTPIYAFIPATVHVRVGETVEWHLRDLFDGTHHATKALDGSWDSGPPGPGTFSHTFTTTGQFPYKCSFDIHAEGLVIVDP